MACVRFLLGSSRVVALDAHVSKFLCERIRQAYRSDKHNILPHGPNYWVAVKELKSSYHIGFRV